MELLKKQLDSTQGAVSASPERLPATREETRKNYLALFSQLLLVLQGNAQKTRSIYYTFPVCLFILHLIPPKFNMDYEDAFGNINS